VSRSGGLLIIINLEVVIIVTPELPIVVILGLDPRISLRTHNV
jgi:hypothetical protein